MFNLSKHSQVAAPEVSSIIGDAAKNVEQGYQSQTIPGAAVQDPIEQDALQQAADDEEQRSLLARMGGLDAFNYFMEEMKGKYGPAVEAIKTQLLSMPQGSDLLNRFTGQSRSNLEQQVENAGDFAGVASMAPLTDQSATAKRQIEQYIQGVQKAEQNKAEMLAAAGSFNLKHFKSAQMMPQPMGQIPMEQPMAAPLGAPEEPKGQFGRFPVQNEGDFISKFADDLLNFENVPGTPNYMAGKQAAEEILDAVSPGYESEADSILESVMQLDVMEKDKAANSLIKLYEVLLPRMMKSDENVKESMEPVMSEKNTDAIKGIIRYSLTDSVLNNQKVSEEGMVKTAADQFGQQYMLYGPSEKRICPKLRGKNLSVGDVVSEYTCRMHCVDGIVIDDNKTICGEALWRANVMDKFSTEYKNEDGETVDGERTRLMKACQSSDNPHLYTIVVLALSTGMRQGEIMGLTWDDVDLNQGRITLRETKNGEIRVVPLVSKALNLLRELPRQTDTPLLFPNKVKQGKPMDLRVPWEKALKKAKIGNFHFHDLRHSAASYLAMNGATIAEIAEVLGHKTLQMVKRYAHLSESHVAGVVGRMNDQIFGL